jgi:hypothetical protein
MANSAHSQKGAAGAQGSARPVNVQIFDPSPVFATQVWEKPAGARRVRIYVIGGGGGGGSGCRTAATSDRAGGGGGGGGGCSMWEGPASDLSDELTLYAGHGGTPGAGKAANSVGAAGADGEDSFVFHQGTFQQFVTGAGGKAGAGLLLWHQRGFVQ